MTTEETRRITIAQLCGWQPIPVIEDTGWLVSHDEHRIGWLSKTGLVVFEDSALPDYDRDLNATAEMERSLPDGIYITFSEHLDAIIVRDSWGDGGTMPAHLPRYHSGTAAQRCEAFLRTHGKWES